ncbi:hypothetical protein GGR51DRAFT_499659 [Nemania sp. FL0031]|nr:hypothetical protein GGR51DRAFT_499659 [Nemania sp. FL0031]
MRVASFFTTIALGYVVQGRTLNLVGRTDTWSIGQTDQGITNLCDTSTFKPETSSELPLAEDCEKLVDNLNSHKTRIFFFWNKAMGKAVNDDGSYLSFAPVGTCAFAAMVSDDGTAHTAISWGDAANIIRDSIHDHSTNGGKQVRTSGSMQCAANLVKDGGIWQNWDPTKTGKRTVSWQIYKPGDNSVKIAETAVPYG